MRKNKVKAKKHSVIKLALLGLLLCAAIVIGAVGCSSDGGYSHLYGTQQMLSIPVSLETSAKILPESVSEFLDDEIYSKHAYLCLAEDCSVIAEKNSEERFYPASLTKIMTTLVLLENCEDIYAEVTLSPKIYNRLYNEGASMAGFLPGEKVRFYDLLCGIMLPSGAEAAVAAAEYIAGSEEGLVALMNRKAAEIGLANTHFANITGLHDDNHYTNVSEMAKILSLALENPVFREISSMKSYTVQPTNKHDDGFVMNSTVFKKLDGKQPDEAVIYGGKTGFTYEAGLCLATYAQYEGEYYIAITLGAEGNHRTHQYQVDDAIYLYNSIPEFIS